MDDEAPETTATAGNKSIHYLKPFPVFLWPESYAKLIDESSKELGKAVRQYPRSNGPRLGH